MAYGMGYGLAKMAEGLTGGAMQAKQANRQRQANQQRQNMTAFKTAYEVAGTAPAGQREQVFQSVYSRFGSGQPPKVAWKGPSGQTVQVDTGPGGFAIEGDAQFISQAMPSLEQKPDAVWDVIQAGLKSGGISKAVKNSRPSQSSTKYFQDAMGLVAINPEDNSLQRVQGFQPKPARGVDMEFDDTGRVVRMRTNAEQGGGTGPMGRAAQNVLEKQTLANTQSLGNLLNIKRNFKPEFQQVPERIGFMWDSVKEKLGANLEPNDQARLRDYAEYLQGSFQTLNDYIRSVTGAAMSESEANRIMRGTPNPGEGISFIWRGDSPTEYEAKLNNMIHRVALAVARDAESRKQGFEGPSYKFTDISDMENRVVNFLERKSQEIAEDTEGALDLSKPADRESYKRLIADALKDEYGIDIEMLNFRRRP